MTASMPHAANDSGGSEVSSSDSASAAVKSHRGTGVFMPRAAAGSMVPQRPQAASTATQLQLQQQAMRRSYSGSGSSLLWPGTQQQQPFGGPPDNSSSCRSCSCSSSIAVPQSSKASATPPRPGTGTSSSNCNSVILALPENPYLTHHHLQPHSAPLAHPVAVQYAAAAAAALGGTLDDDLDDTLCLPGGALRFSELSGGLLGASPGACSDDLAFGPASLPGGYNTLAGNSHALAGNSFTAAAELNRSLTQLPGSSYSEVSMQDLLSSSVGAATAQWPHSKAFEQHQQQQQQQQVQPSQTLSASAGGGSSGNSFNGRNSSSSSGLQRGQWPASSPLPQPQPLPAAAAVPRRSSRGAGQLLLSQPQQSTSLSNNGFWYAQQQLEASSDQMLGSSYQQQQLLLHQQMQQMLAGSIAGGAAEADANAYLPECSSPGGTCAPAGLMPSSSLGMPGQQQQQQQVRLQRRSTNTEPAPLWPSALDQQLHSQIGSSSSSSALQPLVRSSSGGSQELQTVHAINAQLEQLLKLKEDVLAAKASVQGLQLPAVSAAATAAMSPPPPPSPLPAAAAAAAPAYTATANTNTRYADLLPELSRMSSLPEQLQHLDYQPQQQQQQQQQLFSAPDLQQQQQYVLGSSLGSAGFVMPSSFPLALGMQDFAPPAAASTAADLPLHRCRRSSSGNFGSSRVGQRLVVGSWSGGECSSSGGLPALELARQKHAVRAATEQKLQQLAALQRMQSNLQEELMHMLQ